MEGGGEVMKVRLIQEVVDSGERTYEIQFSKEEVDRLFIVKKENAQDGINETIEAIMTMGID
jgi:hypothetical protein